MVFVSITTFNVWSKHYKITEKTHKFNLCFNTRKHYTQTTLFFNAHCYKYERVMAEDEE